MARNVKSNFTSAKEGGGVQAYYTGYPQQPSYKKTCVTNMEYDTISNDWPRKTSIMGPASLKHLYTGIPNYYPPQFISRPVGTMYDTDMSRFGAFGKRENYGFQAYPFHHHSLKEHREYSKNIIPTLNLFDLTQYKTHTDGSWGR